MFQISMFTKPIAFSSMRKYFILFLLAAASLLYAWQAYRLPKAEPEAGKEFSKTAPADYLDMLRNYPDLQPDLAAYHAGMAQCRAQARAAAKSHAAAFDKQWVMEGPNNIGGRINCIAVHPKNSNTIFAGSVYGGIYKSSNGGQSWRPVFDSTAYLAVGCITIDQDSGHIMYAGTGDPSTAFTAFSGNGIYKSTDEGEHWSYLGLKENGIVSKILIHPANKQVLYAATMGYLMRRDNYRGLYKSTDGGNNWSKILGPDQETGVMDVQMDPNNPDVLYATTMRRIRTNQESIASGTSTRIYKSTDAGANWTLLDNGLPAGSWCKVSIDISPASSQVLYASISGPNQRFKGLYKSSNAGSSWQALNTSGLDSNILGDFAWYFGEVRVNPFRPNEPFLQGVNLWRSKDGGNTWGLGAPEWFSYEVHADKHFMHFYAADAYLLATDGGVYSTIDGGDSWSRISNMPITQFYRVTVNYHEDKVYCGGAQDQGTSRGGAAQPNAWDRVLGGDGFKASFAQNDPALIWAQTQNGRIFYSTQAGINFESATDGVDDNDRKNWDSPYLLSKYNTKAFLGTQYVYQADDYFNPYFNKISPDLTDGNIFGDRFHNISSLAQSERSKDILYAGTSDGNVWRSSDEGNTWENITAALPQRYVTGLASSYKTPGLVYVTHSGYRSNEYIPHIHRSMDTGSTWQDISANLPQVGINDVLTFPYNDQVIAVATDGGVYVSINAGQSWQRMGSNMPVFPVFDIEFDTVNRVLIAGTHARSMMSYDMKSFFSGISARQQPSWAASVKVFPNPVQQQFSVQWPAHISCRQLEVYNLQGQRVLLINQPQNGAKINSSAWEKGIYFLRLQEKESDKQVQVKILRL